MFGQLPVSEEGERLIQQADAICRYLGRKHDLCGDSVFDHSRCDIVQQALSASRTDLFELYWDPFFSRLRELY